MAVGNGMNDKAAASRRISAGEYSRDIRLQADRIDLYQIFFRGKIADA